MSTKTAQKAISFEALLTILFIVLKLTGVINWSWWIIFLPLYAGFLLVLLICVIAIAVILIYEIIERCKKW